MEENQSHAKEGVVLGPSTLGFHSGHVGSDADVRSSGVFAYRLVHTQESVRLLDLRLDFSDGIDVVSLGRLLLDVETRILESAVRREFELAAGRGR